MGHKTLAALCSALRGARSYSWEHAVFTPLLDTVQQGMLDLLSSEGMFELDLAGDAFHVNGQPITLEPHTIPLAAALRTELRQRGVAGIRASLAPPKTDLRLLLRLFRPAPPPHLDDRGDPARPFKVVRHEPGGWQILATGSVPNAGGQDIDDLLVARAVSARGADVPGRKRTSRFAPYCTTISLYVGWNPRSSITRVRVRRSSFRRTNSTFKRRPGSATAQRTGRPGRRPARRVSLAVSLDPPS